MRTPQPNALRSACFWEKLRSHMKLVSPGKNCREDEEPLERFNRPVSQEARVRSALSRAVASENDDVMQHEVVSSGCVVDIHEVRVDAHGTNFGV